MTLAGDKSIRLLSNLNKTLDYFRDSIEKPRVVLYIDEIIFTEFFFAASSNELPWTRIGLATKVRSSVFRVLGAEKI